MVAACHVGSRGCHSPKSRSARDFNSVPRSHLGSFGIRLGMLRLLLGLLWRFFCSRRELLLENLALRRGLRPIRLHKAFVQTVLTVRLHDNLALWMSALSTFFHL